MKASSLNPGPPFPEMQCSMQFESSLGDCTMNGNMHSFVPECKLNYTLKIK